MNIMFNSGRNKKNRVNFDLRVFTVFFHAFESFIAILGVYFFAVFFVILIVGYVFRILEKKTGWKQYLFSR